MLLEIVQKPATPADELQQAPPRIVVLRMRAQMLGEFVDPLRQERDLHLRGAGVGLGRSVRANDLELCFLRETHVSSVSPVAAIRLEAGGKPRLRFGQGSSDAFRSAGAGRCGVPRSTGRSAQSR